VLAEKGSLRLKFRSILMVMRRMMMMVVVVVVKSGTEELYVSDEVVRLRGTWPKDRTKAEAMKCVYIYILNAGQEEQQEE
jgi:hypothetical protein